VRGAAADEAKLRGLRRFEGGRGRSALSAPFRPCASLPSGLKFLLEQMDFLILLLLIISSGAVSRAQVQQEPSAETSEGTGINITCSHPNIQTGYSIQWYRQLPGRAPTLLVSIFKGSKKVLDPAGQRSVSADRRSSALWLDQPRLGDAAVYYCALVARGDEPGLRPCTNRFGRGGGTVPSGPAGGAACRAAKLHPDQGAPP